MNLSRRTFLRGSAATASAALFNIVPARVLGQNAPSNRIAMAMIGVGGMGRGNMGSFLDIEDVTVRIVCDVNMKKMEDAKRSVDERYKNADCLMSRTIATCARAMTSMP